LKTLNDSASTKTGTESTGENARRKIPQVILGGAVSGYTPRTSSG
jgi:hypothetical protein